VFEDGSESLKDERAMGEQSGEEEVV